MDYPAYFLLWAKTDPDNENKIQPLLYHMLDVGECCQALWNFSLSEQTRRSFTKYLNLDEERTGRQLAFWAALHDIGKAAPGFQRKYKPAIPELIKNGFTFLEETLNPAPHGILTAWALRDMLIQETGLNQRPANLIASVLGGHHGSWPTSNLFQPHALRQTDKGDLTWSNARKGLFQAMTQVYRPIDEVQLPIAQDECNTFLTLFSGFVSVADWIGSMDEYFPYLEKPIPVNEYSQRAADYAKAALKNLGWLGWQAQGNLLEFAAMFPKTPIPNEIQKRTFLEAANIKLPALVILEAPTGIGKTEAALYLADTWLQTQKGKGIYIAMPTQATSNQMYERVVNFLHSRYPMESINAHLVHGAALLADGNSPQPQGIAQDEKEMEGSIKAETWFLPRKRTLLAPFGVGTVDQAFLSVLQTRHFFVRMFGLGQKVLIFDEVHAYDTYMSTLFERLLPWLRSIGTSVILLSATLPEQTRKRFVQAWLGNAGNNPTSADYPRLTVISNRQVETHPLPSPTSRTLRIDWIASNPIKIAEHLVEKLKDGGCAAVICNRVRRAQEIYQALQSIFEQQNLILFHARFPFTWRKDIENKVLKKFGKYRQRPLKAIVVATQVIEQSLDLDFDYMVTDLAPLDLVLQRAGRLHRHVKNSNKRPQSLMDPCLAIALPDEVDGFPDFGLDSWVYEKAILLRSWLVLHRIEKITLPEQTSELIEAVYGNTLMKSELNTGLIQLLQEAENKARLENEKEIYEAKKRLIALPDDEGLISNHNVDLEEDDIKVHETFRALTRLADPSISIICLHQTQQGVALEPDGSGAPIDLSLPINKEQAREFLKRAVSLQRRDVVDYFINHGKTSTVWRKSAVMRNHYPVVFSPNGIYQPEGAGFFLKLTRDLGLEVLKEA